MARVFLLGATGYLGGEILHELSQKRDSDVELTCLVRDESKADLIKSVYAAARTVVGSIDDAELLKKEVENTDIVLSFAATAHVVSVRAIADAFATRKAHTGRPGYWVQISGGSVFGAEEVAQKRYGFAPDYVYDDLRDRDRIISIINGIPTRVSEQTVLAQSGNVVKTALIIGPHIYGRGRGPGNKRTVQCTEIAKAMLNMGHGFKIGKGETIWSDVHVQDIAGLTCLLVNAAKNGKDDGIWNKDGIYNPENGQMTFGELNGLIAKEAKARGWIQSDDLSTITPEEANALSHNAAALWATNSAMVSSRAREKLGWKPSGHSLADEVPNMVEEEAKTLGLIKA